MEITVIEAKTLSEAWFQALYRIQTEGREYTIDRGSYKGLKRREFEYAVIKIEYPGSRPLVPDVPPGVPAPVTQEYIDGYLPYLMTGYKQENEQIPEVIKMYKEDGFNTNQAYMAVGSSQSIFLEDPQCLRGIDTGIRDGRLNFFVYFRSWDLWGGFPANLGGIQILKEYMASEIGVEDGEIIAASKGLHLYEYSWDVAKAVLRMK
jgi:thymidylate synthase